MTSLVDTLHVLQLLTMMGWLPLLKVSEGNRAIRQALHQHARNLLFVELGKCGLLLQPTTPLSIGTLAHLLYTIALFPMLRQDCRARGSVWHGQSRKNVELRAAVRHKFQDPSRQWQSQESLQSIGTIRKARRESLHETFPDNSFAEALAALALRGDNFLLHRWSNRRVRDAGGYLRGLRLEVMTLYSTVCGFEVYLRWSRGQEFDPQASPSPGSDSGSD